MMERYDQIVIDHLADADLSPEQLDKVLAIMSVVVGLVRNELPF